MLRTFLTATVVAVSVVSSAQTPTDEQRRLDVTVKGVSKDTVFLANYYGNKLYYADTAMADAKGRAVFSRPKGYKSGVYAVVVPGPKYFEVLLDEPEVVVETDTSDLLGRLVVKKSEQNRLFNDYIKYLNAQRKTAEQLRVKLDAASSMAERDAIKSQQRGMDQSIRDYQDGVRAKAPGTLLALIMGMSTQREPIRPMKADGTLDSAASYFANRSAFWNDTDLKDERIVRTPVFHNKFNDYFSNKYLPQIPDTLNKLYDEFINKLGPSEELFKFVVHNLTYMAETSDIMGMDAVFVHMAQTYYCGPNGKATWMPKDKLEKMCERAKKQAPLIIGTKSKNIILPDTTEGNWKSLHHMPEEYVVLVFWESSCGHCKKEVPELHKIWKEELQALDVGVYAVCKATDSTMMANWKKFIVEHKLDWTNVGLTHHVYEGARKEPYKYIPQFTTLESLNYADTYDVYATPKVFILDRERKFVAKSLNPDQIADLIKRLREQKAKKEKKAEQ